MLSRPVNGWTDFQLEGTSTYGLSYLNDVAIEWLEQAIHGLKTLSPFCVRGFLEPRRLLCVVSFWNCHIIVEDDDELPTENEDIIREYSHTNMISFCRQLYEDVSKRVDEWAAFEASTEDAEKINKATKIRRMLEELKLLIAINEQHFGSDRCFF